ncbi:C39 family peptidase [Paenibacillus sp. SYP-B4298]|uniref:C39 family peptidase n=1 Tax=Paenibacillus sp. SYP-B4298 TaxID=2996034 RepID=UPI0022DDFADE|nr:C39 family peptidase [Paenibacillus sp. SYP-B4298]
MPENSCPSGLIDISPIKEMDYNCIDGIIASVAGWLGRDYELMFLGSWDFAFSLDLHGHSLGRRMQLLPEPVLQLLDKYHGIRRIAEAADNAQEGMARIEELIPTGVPVVLTCNAYWVPWDKYYGQQHTVHSFLVVGIDVHSRYLYCTDPYYRKNKVSLSFEHVEKAYASMSTFVPLSQEPPVLAHALQELQEMLKQQQHRDLYAEMNGFAHHITSIDLEAEAGDCEFLPILPLFEALQEVAQGRHKFARSLDYLGRAAQLTPLQEAAAAFRQLGDSWNMVRGTLMKMFMTGQVSEEQLSSLSCTIRDLSEQEQRWREALLWCTQKQLDC